MREDQVIKELDKHYAGNSVYRLSNVYMFKWESDFFIFKQSQYTYEIEVKTSRSDFLADFKKLEKHRKLSTGTGYIPNRFYYAVPEGLISKDEIPEYSGLLYVKKDEVIKVKEAPIINKEKESWEFWESRICEKLWYRYLDERLYSRKYRKWIQDELSRQKRRKKDYSKITQEWVDKYSADWKSRNIIYINGYEVELQKVKQGWSVNIVRKYGLYYEKREHMSFPDVKYVHEIRRVLDVLGSRRDISKSLM